MDFDGCVSQIQSFLENSPLIVLGSGASMAYGLPSMDALATEIVSHHEEINDDGFDDFCIRLDTTDIETAIDESSLKPETLQLIREITWNYINSCDLNFFNGGICEENFVMAKLLKKVIQPSPNSVSVITTNYDRIAEYAADIIEATTITGFEGALIKKQSLPSISLQNKRIRARERTVSIWKVHGSLDWFISDTNIIRSYPFSTKIPNGFSPLIVPPGKNKYSVTHDEPYRSIISEADKAFISAGSYLCIGYGFNDEHIQPKLLAEIQKGKPIVVLAKKITPSCRKHLIDTKINKCIVIECADIGKTKVYGNGWSEIYDGNFWNLEEFIQIW